MDRWQRYGKDVQTFSLRSLKLDIFTWRNYIENIRQAYFYSIIVPTRSSRNGKTVPGNKLLITSSSNYAHLTNVILTRCND